MSPWAWAVFAVLIAANALYVAAEFGAVGVRRSRIRRMADDGHRLARRLLPLIDDPMALDRYVGVSQVGITLSSLILGAYAQATLSPALGPPFERWLNLSPVTALSVSTATVLVGFTALQLVLGELVPKAVALQHPTETALSTVLPMRASFVLFRPLITLLNGTALLLLRLVGATEPGHRHLHSPEEIDLLIAESRDGGLLEPEEQQRLRRALHLGLRSARDLMVPRDRLTMLDVDARWEDILQTVTASPFSRLPVYRGSPDRVIGLIRVKDLVERYVAEGEATIARLLRPVFTVAEDLSADRVVGELREHRAHSAIVTSRDGRAIGLITVQDLLGELLGDAAQGHDGGREAAARRRS